MLLKRFIFVSSLGVSALMASEPLATPPAIPMLQTATHHVKSIKSANKTTKQSSMPQECQMMPPMMILLPPPMEIQLVKCKNKLYLPKKEFAQAKLSKYLKKQVKIKNIEIVNGFSQLYKIIYNKTYVIYTNKTVSNFIR